MADTLTDQIVDKLNHLPIVKRKAILELIKTSSTSTQNRYIISHDKWRKKLLTTSVWTDLEINEIHKTREYINTWKPEQFF